MTSRAAFRSVRLSLLILAGLGPGAASAQAVAKPEAAVAGRPGRSADEEAIRAVDQAFVRGYTAGDAKALAAMFTEDAEAFEADGARYRGRDLIERSFAETFAADKGAKIALEIESIRFLTPDVAKEEGRSVVTPAGGSRAPVARFYTVLFVKRDGRWLMASVREELDPVVRPQERLKELEWMVGDWVDEGPDHLVRVSCRWSADGNFLLRDFTVRQGGKTAMSIAQRVGWDPVAREYRSWEFDSEGGFGEGRWSRDGDRWGVKETGVRPEGVTASSTRAIVREGPDRVRWTLFDRVVAGEALPGEETSLLTRVPPAPGLQPGGGEKSPASTKDSTIPNTSKERSPR